MTTTMADVARAAGVSVSTVSHVVNATRAVSPETRERIEQAMRSLGYRRNAVARSLARRSTTTVGVAISALTNPYFGPLVGAMNEDLERAGFTLVLGDTGDDPDREGRVVGQLLDRRVDGLILAPTADLRSSVVPQLLADRLPVVLVDRTLDVACDQVAPANRIPVANLTSHLADLGHTRIGVVCGLRGLSTTDERLAGYLDVVGSRGLDHDPALVLAGQSDTSVAHRAALAAFSQRNRPTAVVVLNNTMTIGVMRALRELDLTVPEDVALVAYDDFEWSDLFSPRLTAAAQDVETMAQRAVELLLARIADPGRPPSLEIVPPTISHRDSCGCPGGEVRGPVMPLLSGERPSIP